MITELFSPRSKGTVTLKSADPSENPIIDCNYLSDPLDLLVLTEGCQLGNEIVLNGAGTKDVVKGSWPQSMCYKQSARNSEVDMCPAAKHHTFTTREEWIPHVKQNATTCYHAAGTCKMGAADDQFAVLDANLNVRGVKGLRVADCSSMPSLHGGHTQMPA